MSIVILTGAGISAESGLGTFRDKDGLWTKYDLNEVATPEGFARDPGKVHAFYNARRRNAREAIPNAAHHGITRLTQQYPGQVTVITQNVDGLHEQAGTNALHMHGHLDRARCAECSATWDAPLVMNEDDRCDACGTRATRPDIVWFGEIPMHLETIAVQLAAAELFVAIGTSGQVYPAAGFVRQAAENGAETLELNLEPSDISMLFSSRRYGPASEIVPAWVDDVLNK